MLISLFFATLILFLLISMFTGAPYVTSKTKVATRMVELLNLKPGKKIYDLGSGDGRLLILAAQRGLKGMGIEINPYVALWSWIKVLLAGQIGKVTIKWGNYWWTNLKDADGIVVYALPGFMQRLSQKLRQELKPGTPVISNAFQIPGLHLIKEESVGTDRIFLYRV